LAFITDFPYHKDIRSFTLPAGARQEVRQKAKFKGRIQLRISSTGPVIFQITGPHVEQTEFQGTREVSFNVDPGTEFFIAFQNKSGFFVKPVSITVEVTMYGSKKAFEALEKVKNVTSLLRDTPDFYPLQREAVKEILKEAAEVWGHLDEEGKSVVRELIMLTKKLEGELEKTVS